jgi:predicted CXXCH cytochrome family protein
MKLRWVCLLLTVAALRGAVGSGYVGSDVCAGCHKDIAITQAQTNMARTWQGVATQQLPTHYSETYAEGPPPAIDYKVHRTGDQAVYRVQLPGQPALEFPVEATIGGKRHAISFLFRVPSLEGVALVRAPLVEGRYIHSVLENGLALELGFPEEKPSTYEGAFGRVLTPSLEKRCLGCHVAPRKLGTRVETGVACENCHGPGQAHLVALGAHSQDLGILNPDKLPVAEQMRPCSQCHAGSGFLEDPLGDNLLISDQVTALKNSECWRQTAGQITCTNCHNPHQDAPRAVLVSRAEATCLGCHSAKATKRAGLCAVNRVEGCVACHMPNQVHGAFHLADHWMRVHPEQNVKAPRQEAAWRTTVIPKHLYLRKIVLEDRERALAMRQQLLSGASFFEVARANSVERDSGKNGGYMGDIDADKLDAAWAPAVLKLEPGEMTDVVEENGKFLILQRLPRHFREDAEAVVNEAVVLRKEGKQREAVNELVESLKIYPYFLRALTYLGIIYAQTDNPQIGAGVLEMATRLYPRDQGAHFNLGIAYRAMGSDKEIGEYKRTLDIDADYVPAYLNWGGALFAKNQYEEAIEMYRQGININPLSASLHYSLSVALSKLDRKQEADAEMELAAKIDPKYGNGGAAGR